MTIDFRVYVGIPGSLTIELATLPSLKAKNPTNLYPPLNAAFTKDPDSIVDRAWGKGWITPMNQRLVALGGNTDLQILSLLCPSVDMTDHTWGGTGSMDATTDPSVVNVTPFGTSIYGRSFEVGDYVIWDNPAAANGRYQYEIDQIISLNPFTLQRRSKGGRAGSAQFNTPMAVQAGNFFQLVDGNFHTLWDGSHQVMKFLWDKMTVPAVAASTPGLQTPSIVNLIPVPPAAAALGLVVGP